MDITILGVITGILGPAIIAAAWIIHYAQHRRVLLRTDIREREALYSQFIAECSRLTIKAIRLELEGLHQMFDLYTLLSRIRMTASTPVVASADRIARQIAEQYFGHVFDRGQIRDIALSGMRAPLALFNNACRMELAALRSGRQVPMLLRVGTIP